MKSATIGSRKARSLPRPDRHRVRLIPLAAALLLAVPPASVVAQQTGSAGGETRIRDWTLRCPSGSNPSSGCVLTQPLLLKDGRRLLALQIASLPPSGDRSGDTHALVLSAPLGVHLPFGARLQVDDSVSLKIVFERCDEAGCYAGTPLTRNLDIAMQEGSDLNISIRDLNGREITGRLSLLGYSAGMRALRGESLQLPGAGS